ncbi:response regulator receiver protein [Denitrovibrio acetiphilus DSM 12809]|uniref:Response regulator receiver protein n=1 Tax=Denitrovibrio acetiphilus (strain DSM 12809 / NBRC 114555 / N2460) TaxID=522772 RepID=D4H5D3_DENA2|nr:response regulator [Denitrovibrio acetiphilus]ADD67553.1 response regulator receiver protein [Denitrovibrio acetiphilus DSM 12809]
MKAKDYHTNKNSDFKILYVEDEPVANLLVTKFLKRVYPNVYSEYNGLDAFARYKEIKPDLVITDLNMPVMCGCILIRNIREIDRETPIIVTSANQEVFDLKIDLVKKPVNLSILMSKVKAIASNTYDFCSDIDIEYQLYEITH